MISQKFRELSEIEKKAILYGVIAKRTEGKLPKETITQIVNKLNIGIQYKIKIVFDAKEFAKLITLKKDIFEHSWAGSYGTKQMGHCLFGEVEFGINSSYEYSLNGNKTYSEEKKEEPNFDITQVHCVIIEEENWDQFNNNNEYNIFYTLVIYIPDSEPKLDKKNMELIKVFNIA